MLKVNILIDNKSSWIAPYGHKLVERLKANGHEALLFNEHQEVEKGDILCLLSCEKIFRDLTLHQHNLVVHESALPKGKGWSPITWQILEGKNQIPVTLFEAVEKVDAGPIYEQVFITLQGHELLPEIKHLQGMVTIQLIENFVNNFPINIGEVQQGEATYYPRRIAKDSKLDLNKTIEEQFNLLRVCDNERYPAFFIKNEVKYILKIEKA